MKILNVKGGYDYLPKEQRIRNYINNTLREVFEEFGYNSIETPILCYYDILTDKYDDDNDILKEIYRLNDQGNRDLGLRYDLTVPFAKFIALNKSRIKLPFKRYEIAKAFRDGPVKIGRDREFTQCDVDVVGIDGQLIETELLSLYNVAFKKLGIDIIIKYNSRKLMNGLILECGISESLLPCVTTVIDKIEKISKDEFTNSLIQLGLTNNEIFLLNSYLSLSLCELNRQFKNTNNIFIKEGLEELNSLKNNLMVLGLDDVCVFTSSLARGQNYYTGNVFEVFDKNNKVTCSIGAGGRYDNMITNFIDDGNKYPAVGISFGLSSIYEILKDCDLFKEKWDVDIYVIPLDTKILSLKLANELRCMGYSVDIDMKGRKLKKSLEFASKENIPYVIVFGEDEVNNKCFKLRCMFSGDEVLVNMDNLNILKNIINTSK